MAIICALLLVYFIQHMVHAIQASHVIQGASDDAIANIDYWYMRPATSSISAMPQIRISMIICLGQLRPSMLQPQVICSRYIDFNYFTKDYGGIIRLQTNLGSFVTDKNIKAIISALLEMIATYKRPKPQISHYAARPDALFWQRFIELEQRPSHTNDIGYSLGQITEIAIRALSPGINDLKTAVNCIQSCPLA